MMNSMIAVDTNILIYSADSDERVKGPRAVAMLDELAEGTTQPVLLWQVRCEFTAFIAKARAKRGLAKAGDASGFEYVRAIRDRFRLVLPGPAVADLAVDIHLKDQVSIWDSLLLAACVDAGVARR